MLLPTWTPHLLLAPKNQAAERQLSIFALGIAVRRPITGESVTNDLNSFRFTFFENFGTCSDLREPHISFSLKNRLFKTSMHNVKFFFFNVTPDSVWCDGSATDKEVSKCKKGVS